MVPCSPASHIIDSHFFADGYGTNEARQVFCDYRRMQRWLEVEAALAQCQADLGLIPAQAATVMIEAAQLERLDIPAIQADIKKTGHSLIPLLKEWQRLTGDEAGQFIHYGATTQDIQDTAQSLEMREITTLIERDLALIIDQLATLADNNRDLVTIGRSHGQHALPTTMGLKMAGWLDETLRNANRLAACRERLLVAQLFGGVGTMAALSDQAIPLLNRFAKRLGLTAPLACWHNSRDRLAEFTSVLALISGGLARVANEICQLARNEIGELAEPFIFGQIGSTTMPHKKNPELCEQVVVLARLVKANAGTAFDTLCNEHERDYRAVRLEWVALTEASVFTCAALRLMKSILSGLSINRTRIGENLARFSVLVSTEALMFRLGEKIGKQSAHALIYEASMGGEGPNLARLVERLMAYPAINQAFSQAELEQAIDPRQHTGQADVLIDRVLAEAKNHPTPKNEITPCPLKLPGICSC